MHKAGWRSSRESLLSPSRVPCSVGSLARHLVIPTLKTDFHREGIFRPSANRKRSSLSPTLEYSLTFARPAPSERQMVGRPGLGLGAVCGGYCGWDQARGARSERTKHRQRRPRNDQSATATRTAEVGTPSSFRFTVSATTTMYVYGTHRAAPRTTTPRGARP